MNLLPAVLGILLLAAGLSAQELPDSSVNPSDIAGERMTAEEPPAVEGAPADTNAPDAAEPPDDAPLQWPPAVEIIRRADQHVRGTSSRAELSMEIVRPDWSRQMGLKFWSKGNNRSLILITSPARDRGTTFLLRDDEVWNYRPDIDRVIKLPPSMMSQSWMGTDFTNDDLVRESSIVEDYHHEIVGDTILIVDQTGADGNTPSGKAAPSDTGSPAGDTAPVADSTLAGRSAWEIKLTPKPEAAVVWGEVRLWISKEHYLQLRAEYYDEDGELVNVMDMSRIQVMGGRLLPTAMAMRPVEEEGNLTRMTYQDLEFDLEIDDSFFSQQNMKRIRP